MRNFYFIVCTLLLFSKIAVAQSRISDTDSLHVGKQLGHNQAQNLLLLDRNIQLEATEAINYMYNFKFEKADRQFRWLKQKYPNHPLPYFLLGLSQWWRMVPNMETENLDKPFLAYMDTAIVLAKKMYKEDPKNIEASFFLAASYGFKGRLLAERKSWRKAAVAGKSSLNYLKKTKRDQDIGPEFLFGDALYNYYSVWIPENYPMLKPILLFFRKGDKELGIQQLKNVASNSFYTRTEAQFFLMRILAGEGEKEEALNLSAYLYQTYPENAYFHRYYASMLYSHGKYIDLEPVAISLLNQIESGKVGYEAISGRYAAFYLGQIYDARKDKELARNYYLQTIKFAETLHAKESGYYLYSLYFLGKMAKEEGDKKLAKEYFKQVKKNGKRKQAAVQKASEELKKLRKG
ncbi:tol-pal system protein YbgF [Xanthovirga aplysinae]|uniref:tol-pal system protein YbgF n=1 Tax=Xanthovirga aplysinae TaxID=2529853 RepID=UPI0012BC47BF|nr:tol-pal system protein YbgF [Xanthovirga aplysinae]MTI30615.1 tol-pal system protein YbgF [Xanthovirga aplysinae]